MKRLLKTTGILLVVLITLILPIFATYAATSQSLPGELLYPVKQYSEKMVDKIAAVSQGSYAYFSFQKTQRRFYEVMALADKNQDTTGSLDLFLAQLRKTLFDIQSIPDTNARLTQYAKYQQFLVNAKESFKFMSDTLSDRLKTTNTPRTFTVDDYALVDGKLTARPRKLEVRNIIKSKNPDLDVIDANIARFEAIQPALEELIR